MPKKISLRTGAKKIKRIMKKAYSSSHAKILSNFEGRRYLISRPPSKGGSGIRLRMPSIMERSTIALHNSSEVVAIFAGILIAISIFMRPTAMIESRMLEIKSERDVNMPPKRYELNLLSSMGVVITSLIPKRMIKKRRNPRGRALEKRNVAPINTPTRINTPERSIWTSGLSVRKPFCSAVSSPTNLATSDLKNPLKVKIIMNAGKRSAISLKVFKTVVLIIKIPYRKQ